MVGKAIIRFFENTKLTPDDGVLYWRERVLKSIFLIIIFSGLPPYIFSSYLALQTGNYALIAINTIVYFFIIILSIANKFSFFVRISSIIVMAYIVGLALLFLVGPKANGLSYIIAASILSSLLLGIRGAAGSLLINVILFLTIALGLHYNFFGNMKITQYTVPFWITVASSTEIICLLSSVPLAILLNELAKTIAKQKKLQLSLQDKIKQLNQAKQKAIEADKLKTNFLANMSHEVRTPLNAIMGFTELLMYEAYSDDNEKNKYLTNIYKSGNYLLSIIKNILDFSVIESGQLKLSIKPFKLKILIDELKQIYELTLKEKYNINIIFTNDENIDSVVINSDMDRLKQVLINLINNAINHLDKGEIKVGFSIKDNFIEFFIKDNGYGIPEELQTNIFDRFVKIENKNIVKKGTGLGLPISKGIVLALGGEIWVKSKPGEGATFFFTIPYKH